MKKLLTVLSISCLLTGNALAENVSVPNTFQAGTPAKASEVNENFNTLVQALAQVKALHLYQNGEHKGKSVLLNFLLLDNGYLTIAIKKNDSNNIYLKNLQKAVFYTTSNCTGQAYIEDTLKFELHAGETGVLAAINNSAYSMPLPGVAQNITPASFSAGYGCTDIMYYNMYYDWNSEDYVQGATPSAVYPIYPNNPATTGITTQACVDTDSSQEACFTNAQLIRE